MKMLSDMGSIPIISTIVSTIWVAFAARIVFIYYKMYFYLILENYYFFHVGLYYML